MHQLHPDLGREEWLMRRTPEEARAHVDALLSRMGAGAGPWHQEVAQLAMLAATAGENQLCTSLCRMLVAHQELEPRKGAKKADG